MKVRSKLRRSDNSIHTGFSHSNCGFRYVSEIDRYVLDGYGAWITNIEKSEGMRFDKYIDSSKWLTSLVDDGCELVVGPPAPTTNGDIPKSLSGVYVKNYLERMKEKQKESKSDRVYLLEVKKKAKAEENVTSSSTKIEEVTCSNEVVDVVEDAVKTAVRLVRNYNTIKLHCSMGLILGDIYDNAIDSIYRFENEAIQKYTEEELYSIINSMEEIKNDDAISHIVSSLRNSLYEKVIVPKNIQVSDEVLCLVSEAQRISEHYKNIMVHTGIGFNLKSEHDKVHDDVSLFITKVLTDYRDEDVIGFIQEFPKSYEKGMSNGASFILSNIKNEFQKRTLDRYFTEKASVKEKKK